MNFRLGCAVWSYKGWVGDFYPPQSHASDFLRLYSQRLTTVEGNTTFYATPNRDTLVKWVAQTPPAFEFCLKLPRDLTHQGLLKPAISGTLSFIEQMQELGERLGAIFAQLPPHYAPSLLDDLITFLRALPCQQVPIALEVRHPGWFREPYASQLTAVLTELGVGRVLLDSRPIYNAPEDTETRFERRKPKLPLQLSVTAPFSLIRFISHPQQQLNQPFFQEWVSVVNQWLAQGKRLYFFVHCPIEARSPHNARYFQQMLKQQGVAVPPLPWDNIEESPTQLSLF